MTEPPRTDDEVVSAVLDGEATLEERARVEGDAVLARRLAQFRSVSDVVGGPVSPVDAATRDESIDRALRSAGDDRGEAEVIGIDRAGRRWRLEPNRKVLVAAAAVVCLLALAGGLLAVGDGNEAQDQAGGTAEGAEAGDMAVPDLELGAVEDIETLRVRINDATGLSPGVDDEEAVTAADGAEAPAAAVTETPRGPAGSLPRTTDHRHRRHPLMARLMPSCSTARRARSNWSRIAELIGQLAEGSVTYRDVDAYVFVVQRRRSRRRRGPRHRQGRLSVRPVAARPSADGDSSRTGRHRSGRSRLSRPVRGHR